MERCWAVQPAFEDVLELARAELRDAADCGEERGLEVGDATEDSPLEAVEKAIASQVAAAASGARGLAKLAELERNGVVPDHQELTRQLQVGWEADILRRDCFLPPSDAVSSWDIRGRQLLAAGEQGRNRCEGTAAREPILRIRIGGRDFEQDWHVLASTALTTLREALHCVHDQVRGGEQRFHNYCFYVEGALYCSSRLAQVDPSRFVDVGGPIRDWAKRTSGRDLDQFDVAGVRFGDIENLSIGSPYLFLHQGDCEHRMEVLSVHLAGDQDPLDSALYPLLVYAGPPRRARCMACAKAWGRVRCLGARVGAPDPLVLCFRCFRAFFYDQNGQLKPSLANTRVFPYFSDAV